MSVPDNSEVIILNNETLNLIDDFILDHMDDFTPGQMYWIMDQIEDLSKNFYGKFKTMIDEDITDFAEYLGDEEDDEGI